MDATEAPSAPTSAFLLPPVLRNAQGEIRRAGFELEFAGLSILATARIVRRVFAGDHVIKSTFNHYVITRFGDFQCEIDTSFLKDRIYERPLRSLGINPGQASIRWLEEALLGTLSTIVPIEVGSPPIPVTELPLLDELRRRLLAEHAQGTRRSLFYAFGMHINPEIPSADPAVIRDHVRAFVLLYPWLKTSTEVDFSRSVSPYIKPFPMPYARLILREDYPARIDRLIDDYLQHNPTRNRALDLLPVLAHFDPDRVMRRLPDQGLVKPRPAFHYRLPNCMVDEPGWSLASEWNTWVAVERLANDPQRLARLSREYLVADGQSVRPFIDKWPDLVHRHMGS